MEYIITDTNGLITAHRCGANVPLGAILCPNGFAGTVGDNVKDFVKDFSAYTAKAIVQKQSHIQQQEAELPKIDDVNTSCNPFQDDPILAERFELEGYLNSTDWYFTRFAETGKAIPQDVSQKRAEYRARLSDLKEKNTDI